MICPHCGDDDWMEWEDSYQCCNESCGFVIMKSEISCRSCRFHPDGTSCRLHGTALTEEQIAEGCIDYEKEVTA